MLLGHRITQQVPIELIVPRRLLLQRKVLEGDLSTIFAKRRSALRILQKLQHRSAQRGRLIGGYEQPCLSMLNHIGDTADIEADRRRSTSHRLEDGVREIVL